ncbi:MAG: hypothetical protein ACJAZO_002823 [Myxococcota bacterium]|jgi:hypothetical protein
MNRLQNQMVEVGIDPTHVVIDDAQKATNARHDGSTTAGTEPDLAPQLMMRVEGGI